MSKNPYGGRSGNLEWGDKARKREDADRGLNHRADREAIAEQVADLGCVGCFKPDGGHYYGCPTGQNGPPNYS